MSPENCFEAISLATYRDFVVHERRNDEDPADWDAAHAQLIGQEELEFLGQHGPGMLLLLPREFDGNKAAEKYPDLRENMTDELSDLLWFDFDIAERHGRAPGDLCAEALSRHIGTEIPVPTNFQELEQTVLANASRIRIMNKYALLEPDVPEELKYTSLPDNPLLVFTRVHARLKRTLEKDLRLPPGIPSASEIEPMRELTVALGDHINTLAYIARDRLGRSLEEVAGYNMFKLRHRKQFGKSSGHLFHLFEAQD